MAKKAKGELFFDLDVECIISVIDEHKNNFEQDIKNGEVALSADLKVDSRSLGLNIYPDGVDGVFKFEKIDPNNYRLVVKGKYKTVDDFDYLPQIKQLSTRPKLMLEYVFDREVNSHYIDGNEDRKVELGTLRM